MKPLNNLLKKEINSNPNSEYILTVEHLIKSYGNVKAVNDISFNVKRGSLFAFLGLNGAGKSTTINIICSILKKDSGQIKLDDLDIDNYNYEIKNKIGIVFQNSVLDNVLTARENLTLRAGFYGIKGEELKARIDKLSSMLELQFFIDRPIGKLSGGQKRRVDIARAMIHRPSLLILDEPTTGLNLVKDLRNQTGMTVFLTTHYMEEAEKASYVVIMNKGEIIARGTPTELKNEYSGDYVLIYTKKDENIEKKLNTIGKSYVFNNDNSFYRVQVDSSDDALKFIIDNQDILKDFEVEKGSMDDVFLNVTGIKQVMEEN